jgi:hypothetical protein
LVFLHNNKTCYQFFPQEQDVLLQLIFLPLFIIKFFP